MIMHFWCSQGRNILLQTEEALMNNLVYMKSSQVHDGWQAPSVEDGRHESFLSVVWDADHVETGFEGFLVLGMEHHQETILGWRQRRSDWKGSIWAEKEDSRSCSLRIILNCGNGKTIKFRKNISGRWLYWRMLAFLHLNMSSNLKKNAIIRENHMFMQSLFTSVYTGAWKRKRRYITTPSLHNTFNNSIMLNVILTDLNEDYCSPKTYKNFRKEEEESCLMELMKLVFLIPFHRATCFQFFYCFGLRKAKSCCQ